MNPEYRILANTKISRADGGNIECEAITWAKDLSEAKAREYMFREEGYKNTKIERCE